MADYSWTFNIGKLRIGYLKYWLGFTLQKEKYWYLSVGKLDFYLPL